MIIGLKRSEEIMDTKKQFKKRVSFLPEIGKQLISAMRAESLQHIKKNGRSCPHFHVRELYDLGAIPFDFEARWSAERAIEDVMRKAQEYGFVSKYGPQTWVYNGPEIKEMKKVGKAKEKKRQAAISAWAKSKRIVLDEEPDEYNKSTIRVKLPKKLQRAK